MWGQKALKILWDVFELGTIPDIEDIEKCDNE